MFCPKCKTILYPEGDVSICKKCGYKEDKGGAVITSTTASQKEREVVDDISGTLPTTVIECGKCGHNKASWIIRQTRASDEPETRIYQCLECKHKWREY